MITRQAKMIFSAYRRDEFADPDGFVLQLGLVLERYADTVIQTVTDPRTGIQRRSKFPPSIAEVVEACEAEATAIETRKRYAAIPPPVRKARLLPAPPVQGSRATLFVGAGHPGHEQMEERAVRPGTDARDWKRDEAGRPGIWVSFGWYDEYRSGRMGRGAAQRLPDVVPAREILPPDADAPPEPPSGLFDDLIDAEPVQQC